MKWLVVFNKQVDREKLLERLATLQCDVVPTEAPVRLGADEEVLPVEGPANLSQLLESEAGAVKVYPNSRMDAYSR